MDAQAVLNPQIVVDMIQKRAWLPLGALLIGLAVRLLKSDIKYFPTLASRYRALAAIGLGQVAGTIESIIAGKTYKEAIVWGLVQSVIAMVAHDVFIGSIRNGKEIPVPGLSKSKPQKAETTISISVPIDIVEDVTKNTTKKDENTPTPE